MVVDKKPERTLSSRWLAVTFTGSNMAIPSTTQIARKASMHRWKWM
jgi:hypothetical protein